VSLPAPGSDTSTLTSCVTRWRPKRSTVGCGSNRSRLGTDAREGHAGNIARAADACCAVGNGGVVVRPDAGRLAPDLPLGASAFRAHFRACADAPLRANRRRTRRSPVRGLSDAIARATGDGELRLGCHSVHAMRASRL
jgi:hypothetical protein